MYSKSDLSRIEVKLRREKTPASPTSEKERHHLYKALAVRGAEGHKPQQASGAMLRAPKLLLEEKDKQRTWGGLKRILTKEGHHLWLCPHHLAEYKL
jgi:hypothetical protein